MVSKRATRFSLRIPTVAMGAYAFVGLLSVVALARVYRPIGQWMRYPLVYSSDGLWNLFVIKTVVETGWYHSNAALGVPFGAEFLDFPKPETLFLLFFKVIGWFTGNIPLIHNAFFFLGFPVVAWSATAVFRAGFELPWAFAVTGGLLYAFLPFHFDRMGHLFLSNYFMVPMAVWLMWRVSTSRPPFFERGGLGVGSPTVWSAVALIASTSTYYAVFSLLLILATGGLEGLRERAWRPLASASLVATLLSLALVLNLAPSLWHRAREGSNPEVATRSVLEVDLYALLPARMLLPFDGHRADILAEPARRYTEQGPAVNENWDSALGVIGAGGFVILLLRLLSGDRLLRTAPILGVMSRANAVALLFGVTGGLGTLFALLVSPQIRAPNRISVFIAFFAIGAFLTALHVGMRSVKADRAVATRALAATLLVFGFWDQVPRYPRPNAAAIAHEYESDRAFVSGLDATLPRGASVYQMPYIPFPEFPPRYRETPYTHLRGFLHSTTLRWSYGAIKGTVADLWHRAVAELPLSEQLPALQAAGFHGIYLDRRALADTGARQEGELRALGLAPSVESRDGNLVFFRISPTGNTPIALPLPPILGRGFHVWEQQAANRWAWSREKSSLFLFNQQDSVQRVRLSFWLETLRERRVWLRTAESNLVNVALHPGISTPVVADLDLAPGRTRIDFDTDRPAERPNSEDHRRLAFMVKNITLTFR